MHQAVESGNAGLTRVLLYSGANARLLEKRSGANHSVLYKAIACGHNEIVDILLSHSQGELIDPNALYCATFCKNKAVIHLMITHSSNATQRRERLHQILLHAACLEQLSIIELCLQLGADPSSISGDGETALSTAIKYGRPTAVESLLKANLPITGWETNGTNLLRLAVSTHEIIAERLRCIREYGHAYKGIPEYSNSSGSLLEPMKPDHWFTQRLDVWLQDIQAKDLYKWPGFKDDVYEDSSHVEVMRKILSLGGNVNEKNSDGESLLHLVVRSTSERARAFLEFATGLEIDARDLNGRTPLHYAAAVGQVDTMKLLLEHGANIDIRDKHGASTLHLGVASPACTELIIERGNLIHAQDNVCRTALHYAGLLEDKSLDVKKMLLSAGVRTGTVDIQKHTAQLFFDTFAYQRYDYQDVISWIGGLRYGGCSELREGALYGAIDNSHYYGKKYGKIWTRDMKEMMRSSSEKEKTWTVVSDSDEEDFDA